MFIASIQPSTTATEKSHSTAMKRSVIHKPPTSFVL